MRTEAHEEEERRLDGTDTEVSVELAAIGGEPLEGSGFEEEEPEKEFV